MPYQYLIFVILIGTDVPNYYLLMLVMYGSIGFCFDLELPVFHP